MKLSKKKVVLPLLNASAHKPIFYGHPRFYSNESSSAVGIESAGASGVVAAQPSAPNVRDGTSDGGPAPNVKTGAEGSRIHTSVVLLPDGVDVKQLRASPDAIDVELKVLEFRRGVWSPVQLKTNARELSMELGISKRDLRVVDPNFKSQQSPTLDVRRGAIIVNMADVRAIITHERVLLFSSEEQLARDQPFRDRMAIRLRKKLWYGGSVEMPFELRALDGFLGKCTENLRAQYNSFAPHFERLLDQMRQFEVPPSGLMLEVYDNNSKLNALKPLVDEMHNVLMDVLGSDEDMSNMYLTVKAETGHPRIRAEHEEVELLLESSLRVVDQILRDIRYLETRMDHMQEHVQLTLDAQRNRIMRQNLVLTIGTFAFTAGTFLSSLFGMNLPNPWEHLPGGFAGWSAVSVVTVSLVFTSIYSWVRFIRKIRL